MSIYLNPEFLTKEKWLEEYSLRQITKSDINFSVKTILDLVDFKTIFPVCLTYNNLSSMAYIAQDEFDLKSFVNSMKDIMTSCHIVEIDKLLSDSANIPEYDKKFLKQK